MPSKALELFIERFLEIDKIRDNDSKAAPDKFF
jgi:hypothetical protein